MKSAVTEEFYNCHAEPQGLCSTVLELLPQGSLYNLLPFLPSEWSLTVRGPR